MLTHWRFLYGWSSISISVVSVMTTIQYSQVSGSLSIAATTPPCTSEGDCYVLIVTHPVLGAASDLNGHLKQALRCPA